LTVNYVAPARFKDVPKSHQFYTDIEWLADSGITSGDGSGNFLPKGDVTRAQMAAFMYRHAIAQGNTQAASYKPSAADYRKFKDIDEDYMFAKEILWAASVGITSGDGAGGFSPNRVCTRGEMTAFLKRFAVLHGDKAAASYAPSAADYRKFKDVGTDHVFATDILWASSAGITSGDGAGGFSPSKSVLREQMAAFLHRIDNHLNK
ncbi:S-layer homology domain-containing protein, partial [Bifidobacterium choerinum]|uniref:S-layer homology domain-containing protein n=1 Tax=Bifidobacterium choerinum TaxID=35760 RepID=UPI003F920107